MIADLLIALASLVCGLAYTYARHCQRRRDDRSIVQMYKDVWKVKVPRGE